MRLAAIYTDIKEDTKDIKSIAIVHILKWAKTYADTLHNTHTRNSLLEIKRPPTATILPQKIEDPRHYRRKNAVFARSRRWWRPWRQRQGHAK